MNTAYTEDRETPPEVRRFLAQHGHLHGIAWVDVRDGRFMVATVQSPTIIASELPRVVGGRPVVVVSAQDALESPRPERCEIGEIVRARKVRPRASTMQASSSRQRWAGGKWGAILVGLMLGVAVISVLSSPPTAAERAERAREREARRRYALASQGISTAGRVLSR
ncbi:hypothetical protein K0U83_25415 [bacterium]|nr:hypothetical protein [bacterium]